MLPAYGSDLLHPDSLMASRGACVRLLIVLGASPKTRLNLFELQRSGNPLVVYVFLAALVRFSGLVSNEEVGKLRIRGK